MKAYVFKVELLDSKPLIWRKFVIPADITFLRLHDTLQYVMGWYDCHLHKFAFEESDTYFTNDREDIEETKYLKDQYKHKVLNPKESGYPFIQRRLKRNVFASSPAKIDKYMTPGCTFQYEYDFGDSWIHQLTLLDTLNDYKVHYPRILEGEGNCPPEDVGGIGGYEHFLAILGDVNHPERRELWQWAISQHWITFSIRDINRWMKEDQRYKKKKVQAKPKTDPKIVNELSLLKIGQPATRALASMGVNTLIELSKLTRQELLDLHGVGPKAVAILDQALLKSSLSFQSTTRH